MLGNKLRTPYRTRILYYCQTHGVVVPENFDAPQSSEAIVVIDITEEPFTLAPRSIFLWKEALKYISSTERQGRIFKVLDFKRGCELALDQNRLVRGRPFEHRSPNETLYLIET